MYTFVQLEQFRRRSLMPYDVFPDFHEVPIADVKHYKPKRRKTRPYYPGFAMHIAESDRPHHRVCGTCLAYGIHRP